MLVGKSNYVTFKNLSIPKSIILSVYIPTLSFPSKQEIGYIFDKFYSQMM